MRCLFYAGWPLNPFLMAFSFRGKKKCNGRARKNVFCGIIFFFFGKTLFYTIERVGWDVFAARELAKKNTFYPFILEKQNKKIADERSSFLSLARGKDRAGFSMCGHPLANGCRKKILQKKNILIKFVKFIKLINITNFIKNKWKR